MLVEMRTYYVALTVDKVEVSKLYEVFLTLTQNKPKKAFDKVFLDSH